MNKMVLISLKGKKRNGENNKVHAEEQRQHNLHASRRNNTSQQTQVICRPQKIIQRKRM
jgi:hypothetical protein